MAKFILFVLLCVLHLERFPTAAKLHLEVNPSRVVKDITASLTVNCSFTNTGASNISNLISIIISKTDGKFDAPQLFQDIVSITEFDPNDVKVFHPINVTAAGQFDTNGVSFLSLQWANPTLDESGLYRCRAFGTDAYGRPVDLTQTLKVSADKFDTLESVARRLSTLENKLDEFIETMGDSNTQIKGKLTMLESAVKSSLSPAWFIKSPEFNGRHYLLSNATPASDNFAEAACILQGGYLAEIDDTAESAFVKNFVNVTASDRFDWVLLGATDKRIEGLWEWRYSNQPMGFSDWHGDEPNTPYNDCLLLHRFDDWEMTDFYCTSYNSLVTFLCEVPIV